MTKPLLPITVLIASLLSPLITHAASLKLASWNIAWLGSHKFNKRTETDYKELASYAKQFDADINTLQEIESSD